MTNNLTNLTQAIKDLLEDDSSEFTNFIPTAIDLAEQRLLRELDSSGIIAQVTTQTQAGKRIANKPTDYRLAHEVRFKTQEGSIITLQKRTRSFIEDYWPFADTSTGNPKYYGDWDFNNWIFAPTPSTTFEVLSAIVKKPTKLTATTSTNYYTDYTPDLLLAACMIEMSIFAKNATYLQIYGEKYQQLLEKANNEARRERKDSVIQVENPASRQNNVNKGN